jgi:hypothetical protein
MMSHCIRARSAFTAREDISNRISVEIEVTEDSFLLIESVGAQDLIEFSF